MKKLVIGIAVAFCAAMVNAASINWSISNVYSSGDSTTKGDGYAAYLFVTANSSNVDGLTVTTLSAVTSLIGTDGWASAVAGLSSANNNLSSAGTLANAATGISSDFSSGSVSAFAIVFDAATIADAQNYYLVNAGDAKTVSFTSSTGAKGLSFGSQATGSTASGAWTAVPEPTSGLLMLLGMAGLALRRRRA